jgi:DNA polymerase III subunit delta
MSDAAFRALRTALAKKQPLDRVYYFHGDDDHRKEQIVTHLIDAVLDPSIRDFNLEVLSAVSLDAPTLASHLQAMPMLAARRVVVLRDVSDLKKAVRVALDRYLTHAAEDTLLLLVDPAGTKADAALTKQTTSVLVPAMTQDEVVAWISKQAKRMGTTIDGDAVTLLAEAVGADLALATGELEKLTAYAQGGPITVEAVDAVVGVRRGETLSDLLDAVGDRDLPRAVRLIGPVMSQPKNDGVPIVLALTTQMLALAWAKAKGGRADFFGFLKTGKAFPGRSWSECATAWSRMLPKWSAAELARAVHLLHATDRALKDTRISSEEALITSLVLAMASPTRTRSAA